MRTKRVRAIMTLGIVAAAVTLTGCDQLSSSKTNQTPGERTAGETIDDKTLISRVKDALEADAVHKYPDVKVAAFKGTVQLSGFVSQEEQKKRAADVVAMQVVGVKDLENNITIKK